MKKADRLMVGLVEGAVVGGSFSWIIAGYLGKGHADPIFVLTGAAVTAAICAVSRVRTGYALGAALGILLGWGVGFSLMNPLERLTRGIGLDPSIILIFCLVVLPVVLASGAAALEARVRRSVGDRTQGVGEQRAGAVLKE